MYLFSSFILSLRFHYKNRAYFSIGKISNSLKLHCYLLKFGYLFLANRGLIVILILLNIITYFLLFVEDIQSITDNKNGFLTKNTSRN